MGFFQTERNPKLLERDGLPSVRTSQQWEPFAADAKIFEEVIPPTWFGNWRIAMDSEIKGRADQKGNYLKEGHCQESEDNLS
jgi:hypothetical protein